MVKPIASQGSGTTLAIIFMVVAFGICARYALNLPVLESESLSIWMTDDAVSLTGGSIGEAVRAQVDNLQLLVERVRMSPYMPVHTVLLDFWRLPIKDNLLLMRGLSIAFYLAGLWMTYRLYQRFTSFFSALMAIFLVMIVSGFTQSIAPTVTPFALLMLLSVLSHLALLRWNETPTLFNAFLYFLALSLAVLTHAVALLLISFHAVFQLMRVWRLMAGKRTLDSLSDANERAGLLFWMILAGLSSAVYWLWVTFIVTDPLIELSAQVNLIPAIMALLLPLIALVVALTLNRFEKTRSYPTYVGVVALFVLGSWFFVPQLPDWRDFINPIMLERQPTEPIVYDYTPYSPLAYIETQQDFNSGIALDLSWRAYQAEELEQIADSLTRDGYPIWFIADWQNAHIETLWTLITTQHGYTQTFITTELVGQFTLLRFERQ